MKTITINGVAHPVALDMNAMCLLEEDTGMSFGEFFEQFAGKVRMTAVRDLLYVLIQAGYEATGKTCPLTKKQLSSSITTNLTEVVEQLFSLLADLNVQAGVIPSGSSEKKV